MKKTVLCLIGVSVQTAIAVSRPNVVTAMTDELGAESAGGKVEESEPVLSFLNLKFGMFIHYGMSTYQGHGGWAEWNVDPKTFIPSELDCEQWAEAAKSAKMNYAVFTTKHHDGFCLWDSAVTEYDIASSDYKDDIVKKYADAFRKRGMKVGLYFSVWDRQHKIEAGRITPAKIQYTKDQLTELLTNYGDVLCIVIDGWGSKWGKSPTFEELPYDVLADHIHSIQPDCLVINHSCKTDLSVTQVVHYEATHGQHCPFDNSIPSQQGPTLQPKWFWRPGDEEGPLKPTEEVVDELNFANARTCNYLLNAAPNDRGVLDDAVIKRLAEIGQAVQLSAPLKSLPEMHPVHQGITATASSISGPDYAAQNVLDADLFTRWQFAKDDQERWVELDFGKPMTFNRVVCGEYRRGTEAYKIEALVNGEWKLLVKRQESIGNNVNATFADVTAQKYRLTILKASRPPMIAELTFITY
ncbi:alpha-L-fucosidase [Pontiella sp. NLcol2]|uniref:alpha-L-fucosidase n=1 Tax=Pontiella agarivorans TaxID=3038953 RepID=A0ABU5MUE8_9BACT|nr:alpha-L-fucosidase [Pontiella agarivorans]